MVFPPRTLSVRLSLKVILAMASLLTIALLIMFHFSRKAVKQEALQKAEQTLEAMVQHIDNILLSVEQSAGNIYLHMIEHLDQPDMMQVYARKLVETNPYVAGCAISFEPYYYKDQYFMAYIHRTDGGELLSSSSPIIQAETFGNRPYNEQVWYTLPMHTGRPCWINPMKGSDAEGEAITSFCIPISGVNSEERVGVLGVDVSIALLSKVVLAAKPSPNSYCTLLGSDGSYIIHPDSTKLLHETVFTQTEHGVDPSVRDAAEAMLSGKTGYQYFRLNGVDSYVFYKPFKRSAVPGRSMEDLGWSVGIVYPEDDIFGDYNRLLYIVLAIAVVGLLLLLILSHAVIHRRLLPLRMLARSAQRIADGHYDEPIPDSRQQDEVGRLQNHFKNMQQSLAVQVGELQRSTAELNEQGEILHAAYEQAKEADRVKTAFLHNMTNQMTKPMAAISADVEKLVEDDRWKPESAPVVDDIQQQGGAITELLDNLLEDSQSSNRK